MKQKKTINERTPVAGDVWWVNKTTGAQDRYLLVQTFEKVAIALKLMDRQPYSDGVQVEAMWVDVKLLNYVFYSRLDVYEGGTKKETLDNVQQAVVNIIRCGIDVPHDAQEVTRLRSEIARMEAEQEAKNANADALLDAHRRREAELEKKLEEAKATPPATAGREQAVLNYGIAKREAQIYKQLYYDLVNRIVGHKPIESTTPAVALYENEFPMCKE